MPNLFILSLVAPSVKLYNLEIPKSVLDYVTPEEWEFVKRMEERD